MTSARFKTLELLCAGVASKNTPNQARDVSGDFETTVFRVKRDWILYFDGLTSTSGRRSAGDNENGFVKSQGRCRETVNRRGLLYYSPSQSPSPRGGWLLLLPAVSEPAHGLFVAGDS